MNTNVCEVIVDYAHPAMMVEAAMRNLHQAALRNDFDAAMECALNAMTQARLAYNALREMKSK